MARTYRIICASTEARLLERAIAGDWIVLNPIRKFEGIDSEDDGSFAGFGGFMTQSDGYVATCYKDI